jgi:hypothetical protein
VYFRDRRVTLPGEAYPGTSDLVGELYGAVDRGYPPRAIVQWNFPGEADRAEHDTRALQSLLGRLVSVGYRRVQPDVERGGAGPAVARRPALERAGTLELFFADARTVSPPGVPDTKAAAGRYGLRRAASYGRGDEYNTSLFVARAQGAHAFRQARGKPAEEDFWPIDVDQNLMMKS